MTVWAVGKNILCYKNMLGHFESDEGNSFSKSSQVL